MNGISNGISKRIGNNINTLTWTHGNITLPFVATKEHMSLLHVLRRLKVREAIKLYTTAQMFTPRNGTYRYSWPCIQNGVIVTATADISVAGERDEEIYLLYREETT